MQSLSLRIAERRAEADSIISLDLVSPDGGELPSWDPGAHITLTLRNGLLRQYSLCGRREARDRYRIGVLREQNGRGGSSFVHDGLAVGDVVAARAPVNHFPLEQSDRYSFIAGGIGITPIMPMVEALDAAGADYELFYGARNITRMAFRDELQSYGERVRFWPEDRNGIIPLEELVAKANGALIYACGPAPMLDRLQEICAQRGVADRLRMERFSAGALAEPVGEARSFTAVIASTGQEIDVAADQTLLNALLDAGVDVVFSCEEGTCGTCEMKVLEGEPEHRDFILSESQKKSGKYIMPCVSRATSKRIVLDI